MKITSKGTIVKFSCHWYGCNFVAGIKAASTPDKGENYYADCPIYGAECHANCTDIEEVRGCIVISQQQ